MHISAKVTNRRAEHQVTVSTQGNAQTLSIPPKASGFGSAVNGGELLCLALATCYCNDLYREAGKFGVEIEAVEVEVSSEFGQPGEPASSIRYRAKVTSNAPPETVRKLIEHTDRVAEVHNTLRRGLSVALEHHGV